MALRPIGSEFWHTITSGNSTEVYPIRILYRVVGHVQLPDGIREEIQEVRREHGRS